MLVGFREEYVSGVQEYVGSFLHLWWCSEYVCGGGVQEYVGGVQEYLVKLSS
jgi:hypothetical protein